MKVEVEVTVLYALNETDTKIVQEYAQKYQYNLELAVWYCHQLGKINLHNSSIVEDYSIEKIVSVED